MQGDSLSIRRFRQGFALVAVVSLAVFAASGCGGSGDGASAESSSLSKAEFIAKGDAICKKTREDFEKSFEKYLKKANPTSTAERVEAFSGMVHDVLLPEYEEMIDEIDQLGAPSADAAKVSGMLGALQHRLDEISSNPALISASPEPFKAAAGQMATYGLKGCAESLG